MDEVKRMLTETNPILLITTVIVSLLHMAFEMLAFTSDISHWRNKKQLVGVSVRTILTNCFVQLIIRAPPLSFCLSFFSIKSIR